MKIIDLVRNLFENKNETEGTYVGVRFSKPTKTALMGIIDKLKIPNPVSKEDLHSTVLYTTTVIPDIINAEDEIFDPPLTGLIKKLDIFKSQEGNNCLVLIFICKALEKTNSKLVEKYNAEQTFDEYIPHVTLSYDCGDFDISNIKIKELIKSLEIEKQYHKKND